MTRGENDVEVIVHDRLALRVVLDVTLVLHLRVCLRGAGRHEVFAVCRVPALHDIELWVPEEAKGKRRQKRRESGNNIGWEAPIRIRHISL